MKWATPKHRTNPRDRTKNGLFLLPFPSSSSRPLVPVMGGVAGVPFDFWLGWRGGLGVGVGVPAWWAGCGLFARLVAGLVSIMVPPGFCWAGWQWLFSAFFVHSLTPHTPLRHLAHLAHPFAPCAGLCRVRYLAHLAHLAQATQQTSGHHPLPSIVGVAYGLVCGSQAVLSPRRAGTG